MDTVERPKRFIAGRLPSFRRLPGSPAAAGARSLFAAPREPRTEKKIERIQINAESPDFNIVLHVVAEVARYADLLRQVARKTEAYAMQVLAIHSDRVITFHIEVGVPAEDLGLWITALRFRGNTTHKKHYGKHDHPSHPDYLLSFLSHLPNAGRSMRLPALCQCFGKPSLLKSDVRHHPSDKTLQANSQI